MDNTLMVLVWLLSVAVLALILIGWWKLFEKAGEAGWKVLIPFYNTYTFFRIAGRNGWGFLLLLIPFVSFVVWIVVSIDMAKHFGKGTAYGIFAIWLLPFIGALDLGLGDATYVGEKHA